MKSIEMGYSLMFTQPTTKGLVKVNVSGDPEAINAWWRKFEKNYKEKGFQEEKDSVEQQLTYKFDKLLNKKDK